MIYYGKQSIDQDDIDAVLHVLTSDLITQGPISTKFEEAISEYTGSQYSVACSHGTAALHLACLALGVGMGDIVWTVPNTFVASANCALYCGAVVDFVDIDKHTLNISVSELKVKLEYAAQKNALPKVIIIVHFGGNSCDLAEIKALSDQFGFSIIEDACHALGGAYKGEKIGSCRYSDITVFSFHPVKIVTTAEGGAALTNSDSLAEKMNLFRSHGVTRDPNLMIGEADGDWYYQQVELGYNYRMTELQAALGVSQMMRLREFVAARHLLAKRYNELLVDLPVTLPYQLAETYSGLHLYVIRLKLDEITKTHKQVFYALRESGIGVNLHYIPVHLQPYYQKMGFQWGDFPNAETYYKSAISIPMFPSLTCEAQTKVIAALHEILEK